jgi:hypothetical protein
LTEFYYLQKVGVTGLHPYL